MTKVRAYESENPNSLVVRVELVTSGAEDKGSNIHGCIRCITLFGRVRDDNERWAEPMSLMIKALNPKTTVHLSPEDRASFHPNGGPKATGYQYIHHVHTTLSIEEMLSRVGGYIPRDIKDELLKL